MNVLLVDQQPLVVWALRAMIADLCPGCRIVSAESAAQMQQALAQASEPFDLLLLDAQMDDAPGLALLDAVRASHADLPVVMLSSTSSRNEVVSAIEQGAMGFVPKRMPTQAIAEALQLVMDGGIYVPSMPSQGDAAKASAPATATPPGGRIPMDKLGITPRQAEVLTLLLQGRPNKDIARTLNLSVETVKDHVAAVLRALGVSSRTQAVLAVAELSRKPASA